MNSESVDLIYLDPPFNSKQDYAAPIGSEAAGAEFKDTWTLSDVDVEWINLIEGKHPALYRVLLAAMTDSDKSYLAYMGARLLEMKRLLKPTGSIYLHCDPTMGAYLRLVMDAVFGRKQFRNEIVWSYRRWPARTRSFQRVHDVLLFYGNGEPSTFNVAYESASESYQKRFGGKAQVLDPETKSRKLVIDQATKGMPQRDVWELSIVAGSSKERVGYPTQKPLKLLNRIILASSSEEDVVLDPFCGYATTCVAAEIWNRRWTGIDISPKAAELVHVRMHREVNLSHRHPAAHRPGKHPAVQFPGQPQAAVRRAGRIERRLFDTLQAAAFGSRPHHRPRQGRDGPSPESPTALRQLQPHQGQSGHGVPAGEATAMSDQKTKRKTVELVRTDYQPTKREKEAALATNASFEQAVDALLQPVKVRWIDKPRKRH